MKAGNGDPPERQPEIGDWLWLEDWTTGIDQAVGFYQKLGGYESILKGDDYVVLISEGKWRVGIRQIKDKAFSGRWVPAVRVQNAKELLPWVEALGGKVWLAADNSSEDLDTALISDNTGVLLILQPWNFAREGGGKHDQEQMLLPVATPCRVFFLVCGL